MELLQLLNLILHTLPLRPQRQELILQLGVELVLDVLVEVLDLLALLLLGLGDLLDGRLDVVGVLRQLFQALLEPDGLVANHLAMLLVHLGEPQEFVVLVCVAAEHGALGADRDLARLAIVVQAGTVLLADLLPVAEQVSVRQCAITGRLGRRLVQSINRCGYLFDEAAVDKLTDLQMASAMRALLPLLCQPLPDAISAAEFGARWAQDRVLNLTEANEALENLLNVLVCVVLCLLAHVSYS